MLFDCGAISLGPIYFYFMCMNALACMDVPVPLTCLAPEEAEYGTRTPEIGVTGSCELQCQCWELNPAPQQEHRVLLTTEETLQPFSLPPLPLSDSHVAQGSLKPAM